MAQTRDTILQELQEALDRGVIDADDVASLLTRSRQPRTHDVTGLGVLLMIGVLVMYLGLVLAYVVSFDQLSTTLQIWTPYVFPVIALVGGGIVARIHRPYWEREVIMAVTAIAVVVSSIVSTDVMQDPLTSGGVQACAAAWMLVGVLLWSITRALRSPMLLSIGGTIVLLNATLDRARYRLEEYPNLILAAGFIVLGVVAWRTRQRLWAESLLAAGSICCYIATLMAIDRMDGPPETLTWWHALISLVVASTFVVAPALRMPTMYTASAVGSFLWLSLVIPVATRSAGWALAVVAMGALLIVASWAGITVRRRRTVRS
jgi:hypothetical protein